MAAFLLAERCVTLVPSPSLDRSREGFQRASHRVRHFREAVESLAWTTPLWDAGVVSAEHGGRSLRESVRTALAVVNEDPALAPLRHLVNAAVFDDDDAYLEALSGDLVRGGVDPGIGIPVSVGLDLFAASNDLVVVRSAPTSVVEKAEQRAARPLGSCSVPLLAQATSDRLLEARAALGSEIDDLRAAIVSGDDPRAAAHAYSRSFELERESLLRCEDPDEPPIMQVQATLQLVEMPGDASLRASAAAARRFVPGAKSGGASVRTKSLTPTVPTIRSLIVKPLGRPASLR